jgi:hypothetical protein
VTARSELDDRAGGGRPGLRAAPWLLWFGVLGGAVAWSLHTVVAWGIDETTCRSGHSSIGPIPLTPLLLGTSLLFLVVTGASTVVAWRHWRRLLAARGREGVEGLLEVRRDRAAVMALVGLVMNVFFLMMVAFGTIDVIVFPACQGTVAL